MSARTTRSAWRADVLAEPVLLVKQSQLGVGAGLGLFVASAIVARSTVCEMRSPLAIDASAAAHIAPHDSVVWMRHCAFYDAAVPARQAARGCPEWYRMNHGRGAAAVVRLEAAPDGSPQWRAVCNIDVGVELLWDYGVVPEEWR